MRLGELFPWRQFCRLSAVAFVGAAGFHILQLIWLGELAKGSLYHAAFVAIDLSLAIFILRRPNWFPYFFAIVLIQQVWSPGQRAIEMWALGSFDYLSALVLVMMPVWFLALILDPDRKVSAVTGSSSQTESSPGVQ